MTAILDPATSQLPVMVTVQKPSDEIDVSVIVPAMEEGENIPLLVPRLANALAGRSYEIIIVDDNSRDRTPEVCAELSKIYPLKLRVRTHPKNGLSGAVLHGMAEARGRYFVVMDADLQHPPEKLPEILSPLISSESDFVVGSRYVSGGSVEGGWSALRRVNSWAATLLSRPFAGRTKDPMSGFFALKRESYLNADRLTPLGYKIGLELMCKCRVRNVREIPIHFATRQKGQSKLTLTQQVRYLEHLSRLYDFKYPRLSPIVKFLVVLGCAWIIGAALVLALHEAGLAPVWAVGGSYGGALAATTVFHMRYVRNRREFMASRRPWGDFVMISVAEWIVCALAAMWYAARVSAVHLDEMFVFCYLAATLTRYVLRKEFLHDIRGLRQEVRPADIAKVSDVR